MPDSCELEQILLSYTSVELVAFWNQFTWYRDEVIYDAKRMHDELINTKSKLIENVRIIHFDEDDPYYTINIHSGVVSFKDIFCDESPFSVQRLAEYIIESNNDCGCMRIREYLKKIRNINNSNSEG